MESKHLLSNALRQSQGLVWPLLEDLRSAPLVPSTEGGNHAHRIAGHLLHAEGHMVCVIMQGVANPVERLATTFGGRTLPHAVGDGYPPYEEVLADLAQMRANTIELLESLDEAALDQPSRSVPPGFEPFFGTWRQCFLMQALHWMNHRGQLADCRRSAGREPLMARERRWSGLPGGQGEPALAGRAWARNSSFSHFNGSRSPCMAIWSFSDSRCLAKSALCFCSESSLPLQAAVSFPFGHYTHSAQHTSATNAVRIRTLRIGNRRYPFIATILGSV